LACRPGGPHTDRDVVCLELGVLPSPRSLLEAARRPPARQFFIMTAVFIAAFMGGYHWWRLVYEPALLLGSSSARCSSGSQSALLSAVPGRSQSLSDGPG